MRFILLWEKNEGSKASTLHWTPQTAGPPAGPSRLHSVHRFVESVAKVKKSGIFPLRFLFQFVLKKKKKKKLEARATFLYGSSYLGLRNAAMDVTQMAVLGSVSCLSVISPSSKWLEASLTVHLELGGLQ